jgi:hypothetical protein
MIAIWETVSIRVLDLLLGWLLCLPRDASIALLAGISALLAVWIRRVVCDRQLLGLIRQDERVLKQLIREARRTGDRAAMTRHRRVRAAVARLRFAQEIRALTVMAFPLLALIPWASARMEYLPPREKEAIELTAWLPASSIGELVHLVPAQGLDAAEGWIRPITPAPLGDQTRGHAAWRIRADARTSPYRLTLRFRERTLEQDLLVGQATYTVPAQAHGDDFATELRLRRYVPLGIARLADFGVPPWLLAYLVATLAAVPVLGRLLPARVNR